MESFGLISIVMAAYNAEKTIAQSIRSVLNQTYEDWELIVVDDCSTDRTAEIVAQFSDPRIRLVHNKVNSGVALTRHQGFLKAKGEWVAILDSDDAWTPTKLQEQIDLQKSTQASLLFTGSTFMDADGNPIQWVLHVPASIDYRHLLKQNLVSNSSVLVRKDLLLANEVLNSDLHEDFTCWLRILKQGLKAYGVDKPLLIYRLSSNSKSGNKRKSAMMTWKTFRYVGLSIPVTFYNMVWYVVKSVCKYRHLQGSGK